MEQGKTSVKILKTNDTWYVMTYHADVAVIKDSFKKILENGVYNTVKKIISQNKKISGEK